MADHESLEVSAAASTFKATATEKILFSVCLVLIVIFFGLWMASVAKNGRARDSTDNYAAEVSMHIEYTTYGNYFKGYQGKRLSSSFLQHCYDAINTQCFCGNVEAYSNLLHGLQGPSYYEYPDWNPCIAMYNSFVNQARAITPNVTNDTVEWAHANYDLTINYTGVDYYTQNVTFNVTDCVEENSTATTVLVYPEDATQMCKEIHGFVGSNGTCGRYNYWVTSLVSAMFLDGCNVILDLNFTQLTDMILVSNDCYTILGIA